MVVNLFKSMSHILFYVDRGVNIFTMQIKLFVVVQHSCPLE